MLARSVKKIGVFIGVYALTTFAAVAFAAYNPQCIPSPTTLTLSTGATKTISYTCSNLLAGPNSNYELRFEAVNQLTVQTPSEPTKNPYTITITAHQQPGTYTVPINGIAFGAGWTPVDDPNPLQVVVTGGAPTVPKITWQNPNLTVTTDASGATANWNANATVLPVANVTYQLKLNGVMITSNASTPHNLPVSQLRNGSNTVEVDASAVGAASVPATKVFNWAPPTPAAPSVSASGGLTCPSSVQAGNTATCTITYTNTGNADATNIQLTPTVTNTLGSFVVAADSACQSGANIAKTNGQCVVTLTYTPPPSITGDSQTADLKLAYSDTQDESINKTASISVVPAPAPGTVNATLACVPSQVSVSTISQCTITFHAANLNGQAVTINQMTPANGTIQGNIPTGCTIADDSCTAVFQYKAPASIPNTTPGDHFHQDSLTLDYKVNKDAYTPTLYITIQAMPSVTSGGFSCQPASPIPLSSQGNPSTTQCTATFNNLGTAGISYKQSLTYSLTPSGYGSISGQRDNCDSISNGGSCTVTFTYTAPTTKPSTPQQSESISVAYKDQSSQAVFNNGAMQFDGVSFSPMTCDPASKTIYRNGKIACSAVFTNAGSDATGVNVSVKPDAGKIVASSLTGGCASGSMPHGATCTQQFTYQATDVLFNSVTIQYADGAGQKASAYTGFTVLSADVTSNQLTCSPLATEKNAAVNCYISFMNNTVKGSATNVTVTPSVTGDPAAVLSTPMLDCGTNGQATLDPGVPCQATFTYTPGFSSGNQSTVNVAYSDKEQNQLPAMFANYLSTIVYENKGNDDFSISNFSCTPISASQAIPSTLCTINITANNPVQGLSYSYKSTTYPVTGTVSNQGCSSTTSSKPTCGLQFFYQPQSVAGINQIYLSLTVTDASGDTAIKTISVPVQNISASMLICSPSQVSPGKETTCDLTFTNEGNDTVSAQVYASMAGNRITQQCNGPLSDGQSCYQIDSACGNLSAGQSCQAGLKYQPGSQPIYPTYQTALIGYGSSSSPLVSRQVAIAIINPNVNMSNVFCSQSILTPSMTATCYATINNTSGDTLTNVSTSTSADSDIAIGSLQDPPENACPTSDGTLSPGASCVIGFTASLSGTLSKNKQDAVTVSFGDGSGDSLTKTASFILSNNQAGDLQGVLQTPAINFVNPSSSFASNNYFTNLSASNGYCIEPKAVMVRNGESLLNPVPMSGCSPNTALPAGGQAACLEAVTLTPSTYTNLAPGDNVTIYSWLDYYNPGTGSCSSNSNEYVNSSNVLASTVTVGEVPIYTTVKANHFAINMGNSFVGAFVFGNNTNEEITGLQPVAMNLPAGFASTDSCASAFPGGNYPDSYVPCSPGIALSSGDSCYACFSKTGTATDPQYTFSAALRYDQSQAIAQKTFMTNATYRTITLKNLCPGTVWFTPATGAATYYCQTNHDCPVGTQCLVSKNSCVVAPTISTVTNPSSGQQVCPTGSSAYPGAVQPNSPSCTAGCAAAPDVCPETARCDESTGLCYWGIPGGSSPKLVGSTGTATIQIPNVQRNNGGSWATIWGGGFAARTGCDENNENCQTGPCAIDPSTGFCAVGTNPTPPYTQAELTLNSTRPDFYDIELINGFNIPISITPDSATTDEEDVYSCRVAGDQLDQITAKDKKGDTVTSTNICPWKFTIASYSPSISANKYQALHTLVTESDTQCSADYQCTGSTKEHPIVCGISMTNVANANVTLTCGSPLGFWTTNQLCSESASTYNADLGCNATDPTNQLTKATWLGCASGAAKNSCYHGGATQENCCGCPYWIGYAAQRGECPYAGTVGGASSLCQLYRNNQMTVLRQAGDLQQQCLANTTFWMDNVLPDLLWVKLGCSSAYSFPFDDPTSTFTCHSGGHTDTGVNTQNYTVTFCPGGNPGLINGANVVLPN